MLATVRMAMLVAVVTLISVPNGIAQVRQGFSYNGETVRIGDLPARVQQELYEIDLEANEKKREVIDRFVIDRFIDDLASRERRSAADIERDLLSVPTATEAELRAFYDANSNRVGQPFDQIKDQISDFIHEQRTRLRMGELLAKIRTDTGYRANLPLPPQPRFDVATDGYPTKGNPSARVTVVEFADYQCPHCKDAAAVVGEIVEAFGDDVRVVYRDFPINRSGISREVAKGAFCAAEQDRFWDYHDLAFEMQDYMTAGAPQALAADLRLKKEDFEKCLKGLDAERAVAASYEEAVAHGLSGTPTFFVNGRLLHVHGDLKRPLFDAVRRALEEKTSQQ